MKTDTLTNDYHCSITANIPTKQAFENIGNVAGWWTINFEGSAQKTGDAFTVRFGETFVNFTITEAIPNKKIVWYVSDCNLHWLKDKKEWKDTSIVWEISGNDHTSKIDMTHVGLVPEVECYNNCETGWNHFIKESLFKLLTEQKGLPGK